MEKIPEDSVLIERALSGDEEALSSLVRRYQNVVARLIQRITHRPEWVEDLTQQVFLSAFQNLPRFRRRAGFMTWLYRIAVNASLEALRKEDARKRLFERVSQEQEFLPDSMIIQDQNTGERMVLDREIQIAIREALDKLPAEARAVLTLRYLEEFSTPEISEILKVPAGTVRSRLYYARLELARIMEPFVDSAIPARSKERE
jgi:RNA polymerase sigma-70 factor (ECF subfamily)